MRRKVMQSYEFMYLDEVWDIKWYLVTEWYSDNTVVEYCEPHYQNNYIVKYEV